MPWGFQVTDNSQLAVSAMDKILRDTDITVLTKERNRDHPMKTCTETLEGMECLKKRLGQLARRRESKPKTWPAREGRGR